MQAQASAMTLRRAAPPLRAPPTRPTRARASWPQPAPPHGTVVTAAEQTAGRGRQGRTWTAPPGKALLYSAILRPLDERHLLLPLAVAARRLRGGRGAGAGNRVPGQVAQRRPGRGPQARRNPDRGPPQDGWAVIGVGLNLTIAPRRVPARPPRHGDLALRLDAGVGGVPTEPPRCCSGGTPPGPPYCSRSPTTDHLRPLGRGRARRGPRRLARARRAARPRGRLGRRLRRRRRRRRPGLPRRRRPRRRPRRPRRRRGPPHRV